MGGCPRLLERHDNGLTLAFRPLPEEGAAIGDERACGLLAERPGRLAKGPMTAAPASYPTGEKARDSHTHPRIPFALRCSRTVVGADGYSAPTCLVESL
jgi:hypothetical protein